MNKHKEKGRSLLKVRKEKEIISLLLTLHGDNYYTTKYFVFNIT